jgi:hypothetical protein
MMSESELLTILKCQLGDTIKYANDEFNSANKSLFDSYSQEKYGNEVEGRSQVVASDHFDLVESDMPSLARIFLGSNKVLNFKAFSKADEEEARQKTEYADYLIREQKDSFKILHDWMKEPGLAKCSVVKFYPEDTESVSYVTYEGISEDELTMTINGLKGDNVKAVEIESKDDGVDGTYTVNLRVVKKTKKIKIANVPVDSFIISRGASSKDDATMIGDECTKRKGQLIEEGYSKKLVMDLVPKGITREEFKQQRFRGQGGYDQKTGKHWTNDEVTIQYLYPLVDYDEDGIPERRLIIKCGEEILENEPYGIAPYAILTQILMPHALIGRSRGEIAAKSQVQKTAIERGIMDNIYAHSRPRIAVDDSAGSIDGGKVDLDDLMNHGIGDVIRTDGAPAQAIMPIVEPYIGDSALQIVQYIESKRSNSLGTVASNQGLDSDKFYKETATRFEGVQDSGKAKIELVARVYAETGFRQLYEGVIWTAQHYQDEATEIMVLGKEFQVDPTSWRHEHYCQSKVGLGAGDSEEAIQNLAAQLSTQMQLKATGSPIVDWKKIYATLDDLSRAMGKSDTSKYFNDPDVPESQLLPLIEAMMVENAQLKQQIQQNPLAEAELIKAQAKMAEVQGKESNSMRQFMLKYAQENHQFAEKMRVEMAELAQQGDKQASDLALELTKLDISTAQQVPGSLV